MRDEDAGERLALGPLPLGLRGAAGATQFQRDVYLDTADGVLARRGVSCWLRVEASGTRTLFATVRDAPMGSPSVTRVIEAAVPEEELTAILHGPAEPARLLQAMVDPRALGPVFTLETARRLRPARTWWRRRPAYTMIYDRVTVRAGALSGSFVELAIRPEAGRWPPAGRLAAAMARDPAVTLTMADQATRARDLLAALERQGLVRDVHAVPHVVVLPFDAGRVGLLPRRDHWCALTGSGTGEAAVRSVLTRQFGSDVGQVRLLGVAPASAHRGSVEVWLARRLAPAVRAPGVLEWVTMDHVAGLAQAGTLRDPWTLAALHVAARSDLMLERPVWTAPEETPASARSLAPAIGHAAPYLNSELSLLAFHERVLCMAEDPTLTLGDRVRFLGIVGANLDEFTMVQVGALKRLLAEGSSERSVDDLAPAERLDAVGLRVRSLYRRAYRCLSEVLLPALAGAGREVKRWAEVDAAGQASLRAYFLREVYPLLTPLAVTPGHPFPHIANVTVALAVAVRHTRTGVRHFATVNVPPSVPPFVPLGDAGAVIPIEAVMCANVQTIFAGVEVERAHAFRVTRGANLTLDEGAGADILQAVVVGVDRRAHQPVVRMEVEHSMPLELRELLVQEFRFEVAERPSTLSAADIFEFDRLPALRSLIGLAGPPDRDPRAGQAPFAAERDVLDQIAERDTLVHFPYDGFAESVERMLAEAAVDPRVVAIKLTLYRMEDASPMREALSEACRAGKEVTVFIEVQARFDEVRNIAWVKALRAGGVHVVYGLPGLKTHAKIALLIRREGGRLRRYGYIGTGNFHAGTAAAYTDFGLFTADPEVGQDLADLFNDLTGYATRTTYRRLLVSPWQMIERLLALIAREADHARAGRGARIRAKLNGLDEPEVIAALYQASQAGVEVDLIVRGICALRPGVPGLSERIRVVCVLGRYLEHGRAVHFRNGGADEYYIGSADWRRRNLRGRVEVAVPLRDPGCRARLDAVFQIELADPTAWELGPDGSWRPRNAGSAGSGAQEQFLAGAARANTR